VLRGGTAVRYVTPLREGGSLPGVVEADDLGTYVGKFRWLTAPRSTVAQPGPVHAGLTQDPAADLRRLLGLLVRCPSTRPARGPGKGLPFRPAARHDGVMSVPEQRVGDRERRAVDACLQAALADGVLTLTEYDERAGQCWAARTRSDLDVLVHDLPGAAPAALPARTAPSEPARVTAVLSDSELSPPLAPGQPVTAAAVLGSATVELRRADLPRHVDVRVTAVLGDVKVRVPPGSTVHLSGTAIMGERKVKTGAPSPDGPVVRVDATAVLGSVVVDDKPRKGGLVPAAWPGGGAEPATEPGRPPARRRRGPRAGGVVGAVVTAGLVAVGAYGAVQVLGAEDGAAVFGSRTVVVEPEQTDVEVGVLFGSVRVVVPDDVRARTGGTIVFGSTSCRRVCTGDQDTVVSVRGNGAFGSIEVVPASAVDD
jgi:hypothetical protein